MKPVWTESFQIKSYESGFDGRMKIFSLFNYLQEVAGNHADELKFGYNDLKPRNWYWVLTRIKIEINQFPRWCDTIAVTTWPKGIDRLFGLRDFFVTDKLQNQIIKATSSWVIIDGVRFRPQRLQDILQSIPENENKHAINEMLEKLVIPSSIYYQTDRTVSINDLDVNNHVNNAKYVEWLMDCYDKNFYENNELKNIQVNYLEEAHYGDKLNLQLFKSDASSNEHYIEGIIQERNVKIFQAKLDWQNL